MLQKNKDIFSDRLDSFTVFGVQLSLARENLIRIYHENGGIFSKSFTLEIGDETETSFYSILEKIKKDFVIRNYIESEHKNFLLYGITTLFSFSLHKVRLGSSNFYDMEPEPPTDDYEEDNSNLGRIKLEFETNNLDSYNNISEKLVSYGFIIVNSFSVRNGIPVTFAFPSGSGLDYKTRSFENVKLKDIEQNYSEDVNNKVKKLILDINKNKSGIVVLHGIQGVGKTWIIRAILTEMVNRRAIICSPPMDFLSDVGSLNEVMLNFNRSLMIFEDIGDVLTIDAAQNYVNIRSNLLNISEGLLSLLADSIILLTFNNQIDKIDPAIIRPGRCLANIEVKPLVYEHAQKLVGVTIPKREYTLAEIYQIKNGADPENFGRIKTKIGF